MLSDEKILVTGATGLVGLPIVTALATDNEVWGLARLAEADTRGPAMGTDPASRSALASLGVRTCAVDLGAPDLSDVPDDFTVVLHLAHTRLGSEFHRAVQVNAVGAGLVLSHCRRARALVVSSAAVYTPNADVFHPLHEDDPLGGAVTPWAPSSPVSKVSLEAAARVCAASGDQRVTIVRLNTVYGPMGGLPVMHMDDIVAGRTVQSLADPYPHSPIHIDDMVDQLEPLLDAASPAAPIVNWAGDEVVTVRDWCAQVGELADAEVDIAVHPIAGALNGGIADVSRRLAITGPCATRFAPAFADLYHDRHGTPTVG